MKQAVELPGEYEAMREVLEREEREEDIECNAWKRSEWRNSKVLGAHCTPPMPAFLRREKTPFLHARQACQEPSTARHWCLSTDYSAAFSCASEDDELQCAC